MRGPLINTGNIYADLPQHFQGIFRLISRWPDIAVYSVRREKFLNSGIFATIGYGNSDNFTAIEEKWLCVVY